MQDLMPKMYEFKTFCSDLRPFQCLYFCKGELRCMTHRTPDKSICQLHKCKVQTNSEHGKKLHLMVKTKSVPVNFTLKSIKHECVSTRIHTPQANDWISHTTAQSLILFTEL